MSEITKYMVTGLGIDLANNSIIAGYAEVTDCEQPICMWSDVEPIVQSNKELEQRNAELDGELARLREHVDSLACGVSREAWHNKAWTLLQSKAIEDSEIMKVNIHTIRTVFNATYDALAGSALTKPKLAQEIPAELVKWVNNDEPNLEMDDSADVALEKIVRNECRAFVKSQLEKMKGQKND
jgi:cell division septum initiation protein DivIVA